MHGRAVVDAKRKIDYKLQRERHSGEEMPINGIKTSPKSQTIRRTRLFDRRDKGTRIERTRKRLWMSSSAAKAEPTGTSPKKIRQVYGLDLSYMWAGRKAWGRSSMWAARVPH